MGRDIGRCRADPHIYARIFHDTVQALAQAEAVGARLLQTVLAYGLAIANQGGGTRAVAQAVLRKPVSMLMREFRGDQILMVAVYPVDIVKNVDALDGVARLFKHVELRLKDIQRSRLLQVGALGHGERGAVDKLCACLPIVHDCWRCRLHGGDILGEEADMIGRG